MDIDFSKFLPQDNESTAEYYKRTIGAGVPETASVAERAVSQDITPAARSGDRGEVRVPAAEAPRPTNADDVLRNMYTAAGIDPAKAVGAAYSGARGLAASAGALKVHPNQIKGIRRRGYDFQTAQTTAPTAASPDLSHFERFHNVLDEFEAHAEHHQRLIEEAGGNPTSLDKVYRELGNAYSKVGAAREEHEKGNVKEKRLSNKVLSKGAHPLLNAALQHLTNASNELKIRSGGKYDPIAAGHIGHASIIKNNYGIKTPEKEETAIMEALRGVGHVANGTAAFDDDEGFEVSKPRAAVQRLPLLSPKDAEAQATASAEQRATSGRTVVVGKPTTFTVRRQPSTAQTPVGTGEVRTPSGGVAPQADVERVAQRVRSRQEEVGKAEQMTADILKESQKPTPVRLNVVDLSREVRDKKGDVVVKPLFSAPRGPSSPVDRQAAAKIAQRTAQFPTEKSRLEDNAIRQERARNIGARREESEAKGFQFRVSRSQQVDKDVADKTRALIAEGNIAAAAQHHYGMSYLYHKDLKTKAGARRIASVKDSPAEYLKWHGFDASGTESRNKGTIPNAPKEQALPKPSARTGGNTKTERLAAGIGAFAESPAPTPTRTAPSMFSSESPEQYEKRQTSSRAQRNNAAFRGE